jgi:hypothetical protein
MKKYTAITSWPRELRDWATTGLTKITPENVSAIIDTSHHGSVSRWLGLNEARETHVHELVARLMKDKRYEEAVIVADRGVQVFQYAADNPNLVPEGDLKYGEIYRKAIADFKEIKEYAQVMRDRHELSPILDKTATAIIAAAEEAPAKMAAHAKRLKDATDGNLTIATPSAKKDEATPAPDAPAPAKPASLAPTRENAAALTAQKLVEQNKRDMARLVRPAKDNAVPTEPVVASAPTKKFDPRLDTYLRQSEKKPLFQEGLVDVNLAAAQSGLGTGTSTNAGKDTLVAKR